MATKAQKQEEARVKREQAHTDELHDSAKDTLGAQEQARIAEDVEDDTLGFRKALEGGFVDPVSTRDLPPNAVPLSAAFGVTPIGTSAERLIKVGDRFNGLLGSDGRISRIWRMPGDCGVYIRNRNARGGEETWFWADTGALLRVEDWRMGQVKASEPVKNMAPMVDAKGDEVKW